MEIRGSKPLRGTNLDPTQIHAEKKTAWISFFTLVIARLPSAATQERFPLPVTWAEFAEAAPELAALGVAQFGQTGLALVGTLRRNGWPRISPVEPFIANGQL